MFSFFPKDDHNQTLRIKRFLMACSAYLIWCFIFTVIFLLGLTPAPLYVLVVSIAGLLVCNIFIYAMFRTGFNKQFKDPSLTLLQMLIATFWAMVVLYYAESARSAVLIIYLVVFVFGLFKLNVRQLLFLSAFAVVNYAAIIFLIYKIHPESVNLKTDLLNIVVLAMVLPWFSLVGGYITRLRARISHSLSTIRQMTDNIHDVIFVLDMNLNYTYVSPSVKFLRGYEPEEVLKQKSFDTLTSSSLDLTRRTLSEVLELEILEHKDPISRTLQLEVRCKDGTTVWTETKLSLVRDKNQQPVGILGVMRDITKSRQLEEELRGSEEKYRTILENIQEGYFELDLAGNFTFFNDTLCRISGYPGEELMGMNNRRYMDKAESRKVFQVYNKVYKTGESHREYGSQIIRRDGAKRYIEGSVSLLKDSSGQPKGFRGIARDITERRRAEEALHDSEVKFRNLTDTAQDAIVTTNMKGTITYANPAAQELAAGRFIIGMDLQDFLPPDSVEHHESILALFNSGFSETLCYESKIERAQDDHPLYFDVRSSGLLNRGEPSGFLFVARDATERKRTEEEIRMMAIIDTLTGLYNRRGFIALAEQQMKTAARTDNKLLLLFIDLDGLKLINDNLGHEEGDNAIKRTAVILKRTFRESDIVCRLGGDEFAALIVDSIELPEVIVKRLQRRTDEENAASDPSSQIAMSIGIADYDPSAPCSIHELMSRADELMYKQKKEKKQAREHLA